MQGVRRTPGAYQWMSLRAEFLPDEMANRRPSNDWSARAMSQPEVFDG
jgi:hypothetical protein